MSTQPRRHTAYPLFALGILVQFALGILMVIVMPVLELAGVARKYANCWWYAFWCYWKNDGGVIAMTPSKHGWHAHFRYSRDWRQWFEFNPSEKHRRLFPPPMFKGRAIGWVPGRPHMKARAKQPRGPDRRRHPRKRDRRKPKRRVSNRMMGWTLIIVALAATLINVSDVIADLQDWHGATAPSFVGPFIKQLGTTVLAAFGGKLLPQ